ncbi:hypothetical protein CHLRE_16g670150v5 [Chlamydomonas reinhardtii]|uniref:Uncharacterized protein n=1 Tax=Chlamydomonas reinhardtii TaxID=3055 RepID=A0A2K3CU93_CHLRE|nr:uncharacterized protein CHLRE_16g670150v5 [Chlamydomonas reinhardtii]PNW71858.1 hypothetical protein CHLRE_16g670150v5 [Chlamydomonas reinhardtii]
MKRTEAEEAMATPPGATPDDRDAMHTDCGCYGPSDEQADTESEEFEWADELLDGQIDDGLEALPHDDGSAAVGTDGEESFNRALPAERQSPHPPTAAMFADEAVGAKVSMICSDAPPSSPAASSSSSCASLDSWYRCHVPTAQPSQGATPDGLDAMHTCSGSCETSGKQCALVLSGVPPGIHAHYARSLPSYVCMYTQADTMSEDTIAEIDDALMRGLPGLDDTAFWLTVEELPSDDGSAAIGTDGEESFNRALGALPAERQSPPSPPAAMFADEAVGAKVSMICSDAPPSSPAASSCASLDSWYRGCLLAATGEPAADASVVVSQADGVGDTATSANTNSGDQEAHTSAQAAVSDDMELDPIPMAYLQQPSFDGWPHASGAAAIEEAQPAAAAAAAAAGTGGVPCYPVATSEPSAEAAAAAVAAAASTFPSCSAESALAVAGGSCSGGGLLLFGGSSDVTLAPHAAAASSSDIGIAKKPQSIDKDLAASHDKLQQLAEGTVLWNHIGSMVHVLPPHFRVMAGMVSAQLLEGNQANAVLASREIQQQVLAAHRLAKDLAAATSLLQTQALWKLLITLMTSRNLVGSLPAASATAAAASASAACPAESAAVACDEAGSPDSEATAPPSGGVLAAAQQRAAGRKRKAPSSGAADKAALPPPMEVVAAADETEEEVAPPAAKRPRIEASSMVTQRPAPQQLLAGTQQQQALLPVQQAPELQQQQQQHPSHQHPPHLHHQQQKALERGRPQAGPFRVIFACPCGKELRDHMATVSAKGSVTVSHVCGGNRYERNIRLAKAEEEMRKHGVIQLYEQ